MEEHSLDTLGVRVLGATRGRQDALQGIGGSVSLATNAVKSRVKRALADEGVAAATGAASDRFLGRQVR